MAGKINDTLAMYRARRKVVRAAKNAEMAKAVAALAPRSAAGKAKPVEPPPPDDPPSGGGAGAGAGADNDPDAADGDTTQDNPAAPRG